MKLKKGQIGLIIFNLLYILAFTVYYLSIKNYEFLWYVAVMLFFLALIGATLSRSKFDYFILWGLSLWGFLHMAGGGIRINGNVLYALPIVHLFNIGDTFVLKFDQFVHAFGFAVTTLVANHLLKSYWNNKVNYKVVYPALVCISMGLGSLNEIVEFIAVATFPETGVGGYFNTALDLVFNTIGAIIAVVFIHLREK